MEITKNIISALNSLELYDHNGSIDDYRFSGNLRLYIDYKLEIEDNTTSPSHDSSDGMREGKFDFDLLFKSVEVLDENYDEVEFTYDEYEVIKQLKKILL